MGKKVWVIIGILVLVVTGAVIYAAANKDDMPSYSQPGTSKAPAAPTNETPTPPAQANGEYIDYSVETFANVEGRRWLFFHAGWCPQCRALEKDIQESGVPDGVTIFKVNYDSETALKKKYGVTLQTTVVEVDAEGNEIEKFVAYETPTISAVNNALGQ